MSIYVLRYGALLKIGYSSDLARRVDNIIASIPGEVTFVGHMPGDRDVEAHLHDRFADARFSGEWFQSTPELEAFCSMLLCTVFPRVDLVRSSGARRPRASAELIEIKKRLRVFAAKTWPLENHTGRMEQLTLALGWLPSRVADVYRAAPRIALRSVEMRELDALLSPPTAPTPSQEITE